MQTNIKHHTTHITSHHIQTSQHTQTNIAHPNYITTITSSQINTIQTSHITAHINIKYKHHNTNVTHHHITPTTSHTNTKQYTITLYTSQYTQHNTLPITHYIMLHITHLQMSVSCLVLFILLYTAI